jgi:hypothetical protein
LGVVQGSIPCKAIFFLPFYGSSRGCGSAWR